MWATWPLKYKFGCDLGPLCVVLYIIWALYARVGPFWPLTRAKMGPLLNNVCKISNGKGASPLYLTTVLTLTGRAAGPSLHNLLCRARRAPTQGLSLNSLVKGPPRALNLTYGVGANSPYT